MGGSTAGPRSVVLVDQTGGLREYLEAPLTDAGFAVTTARTAGECLARVEGGDAAGVVSAQSLPDLEGVQLLRSLRVTNPTVPFVLVAADGSEPLPDDVLEAGASGYVPRSEDPATVISRLQEGFERATDRTGDEGHERYRHLIEMSPVAINVFDEDGTSIWGNDAVLDLLGLDGRRDLVGRSIFEVIHPDDHDLARREMESVIEGKESTGPTRMRLQTADGDVRTVRVSTAIGRFLGADVGQAVAVDVTESEDRERQLQSMDRWLRHNVRNEITVIQGIAENIERGMTDDAAAGAARIRRHASRLVTQANRERKIIDLLDPTAARELGERPIVAVVEEAVNAVRAAHPAAEVTLGPVEPFVAMAVPEIGEAVTELLENAIEHNDAEVPSVEVAVRRRDDGRGVVRIADDGPGIPETDRDVLQRGRENDQLHHGSGLGLVFVYWIVRLSGADVEVAENEPRGTVVSLLLDRDQSNEGPQYPG